MITDVRIYIIVGAFMVTCVALMVFNFVVIRRSQGHNEPGAGRVNRWRGIFNKQMSIIAASGIADASHGKFLTRKLQNTENFVVYSILLQELKDEFPKEYDIYMQDKPVAFQKLALSYANKPGIARAFFADFVCNFPQAASESPAQLVDILISYIDDSSIHCRTNVLRALCSIGHVQGVVNAIQVINDQSLFMHNRLLTNELLEFKGDRDVLAEQLWKECANWSDEIQVSIIQFITNISSHYTEIFLPILKDTSVHAEVRFAILRYYGRYPYDDVRPTLFEFIENPDDLNLAIIAASVLASYPSQDTVEVLRRALPSPHWYVRHNAASSLFKIGGKTYMLDILNTETDKYARDIVSYMLEQMEGKAKKANKQK